MRLGEVGTASAAGLSLVMSFVSGGADSSAVSVHGAKVCVFICEDRTQRLARSICGSILGRSFVSILIR